MLAGALTIFVSLPAFWTLVWFLEVFAGCCSLWMRWTSRRALSAEVPHTTTVLIPAHNESIGILDTIRDIQAQLGRDDRILVVADNCTDDTAAISRAAGAESIVRSDPDRRGKGYALEFGVRHIGLNPSDIVIIVDADCRLGEEALRELSRLAATSGRPVQSLYLMLPRENARQRSELELFAWRVKNWLRPLGMQLFGLPCPLFGTGMAFPFKLLMGRDLGNSRLAEDTALGIALASAGHSPLFASKARVYSHFSDTREGSDNQRQRWEKGHLDNVVDLVPQALARSLRERNLGLAAIALDISVPPLSLLVLVVLLTTILGVAMFTIGAPVIVLVIPMLTTGLLAFGGILAWSAVGRDCLPLRECARIPFYLVRKLGMYRAILRHKGPLGWIRTDRN